MLLLSRITKNKQGVSLLELIITMAILAAILVLWWVMNKNTVYYSSMDSQLNIQNAGKSALNLMSKDLRGAYSIGQAVIASAPGSITFRATRILDDGTVVNKILRYRLDTTTKTLIRECFKTATAIPVPPGTLPDESLVILEHLEYLRFKRMGSKVTIEFMVHTPFAIREDQKALSRFTTDVCVRNP